MLLKMAPTQRVFKAALESVFSLLLINSSLVASALQVCHKVRWNFIEEQRNTVLVFLIILIIDILIIFLFFPFLSLFFFCGSVLFFILVFWCCYCNYQKKLLSLIIQNTYQYLKVWNQCILKATCSTVWDVQKSSKLLFCDDVNIIIFFYTWMSKLLHLGKFIFH